MRQRHRHRVAAAERQFAGEQFIGHHAQAVEIGPGVDLLAARLLRAHVGRGPEGIAGGRDAHAAETARDAEVGQARALLAVEQHVVRLHVAMHDALRMRETQGRGDRAQHGRDRLLAPGDRGMAQVAVRQVGHRVVRRTVAGATDFVDADDVRMFEAGDGARLVLEAHRHLVGAAAAEMHDLDRDRAIQRQLRREIHGRHAAFAKATLDTVAVDLRECAHGRMFLGPSL